MPRIRYENIQHRILSRITIDDNGCWNWTGPLNKWGYAKFIVGSRTDKTRRPAFVHRISYETFIGKIPDGLVIDHLCCNNKCQNPYHMEPVTTKINNLRNPKLPPTINYYKTNCPKCGGQWSKLKNRRICKKCDREYHKKYYIEVEKPRRTAYTRGAYLKYL